MWMLERNARQQRRNLRVSQQRPNRDAVQNRLHMQITQRGYSVTRKVTQAKKSYICLTFGYKEGYKGLYRRLHGSYTRGYTRLHGSYTRGYTRLHERSEVLSIRFASISPLPATDRTCSMFSTDTNRLRVVILGYIGGYKEVIGAVTELQYLGYRVTVTRLHEVAICT